MKHNTITFKSKNILILIIKLKNNSNFYILRYILWLFSFKKAKIINWSTLTCLHPHTYVKMVKWLCSLPFKKDNLLNQHSSTTNPNT